MDEAISLLSTVNGSQIGFGALVTLAVISIFRGWLVPAQVLSDRVADKDARINALIAERDDWKSAFMTSEEARKVINEQNSSLVRSAETTNRLLESLRITTEKASQREEAPS